MLQCSGILWSQNWILNFVSDVTYCLAVKTTLQPLGYFVLDEAPELNHFCFYCFSGIGVSLATSAAYLIVPLHFSHQRALALSIASSGSCLGVFIFPPLVELFLDTYGFMVRKIKPCICS